MKCRRQTSSEIEPASKASLNAGTSVGCRRKRFAGLAKTSLRSLAHGRTCTTDRLPTSARIFVPLLSPKISSWRCASRNARAFARAVRKSNVARSGLSVKGRFHVHVGWHASTVVRISIIASCARSPLIPVKSSPYVVIQNQATRISLRSSRGLGCNRSASLKSASAFGAWQRVPFNYDWFPLTPKYAEALDYLSLCLWNVPNVKIDATHLRSAIPREAK
jgi:hypothetical protein